MNNTAWQYNLFCIFIIQHWFWCRLNAFSLPHAIPPSMQPHSIYPFFYEQTPSQLWGDTNNAAENMVILSIPGAWESDMLSSSAFSRST